MRVPANKIILTEEQEAWLRENYATVIHHTICKKLGISPRTLVRMAHARGLVKDMNAIQGQKGERVSAALRRKYLMEGFKFRPENGMATRFKPGYDARELFGDEAFDIMHRKASEARKKTFREERARVAFGLPQRTRLRVRRQPKQKIQDRCYLKRRGYILDDENNIAYWTENTRRATKMESWPRRFYTFKQWKPNTENFLQEDAGTVGSTSAM